MSSTNYNSNNKGEIKLNYSLIVKGTAFTSENRQQLTVLKDALFLIDEQGMIVKVIETSDQEYPSILAKYEHSEKVYFTGRSSILSARDG